MDFVVKGPFEISKERLRKGIYRLQFGDFWDSDEELEEISGKTGVYLFAAKTGGGYTPLYVGKSTASFEQEVFNASNKHKYSDAMLDYERCKPVMFFVLREGGPSSSKVIDEMETFLIQTAYSKNPDIQNVKKTRTPNWSIRGVVRNAKSGAPKSSIEFRKAIGL